MYHAMLLEDCLDLYNLAMERPEREVALLAEALRGVIPRMLRFLLGMAHPDGDISLFNDAALGIEAHPRELAAYWERLSGCRTGVPTGRYFDFSCTGYFVLAPAAGDRLIIDCGEIGPDYQPGHAHCDTLSFELSLGGRRVIVDSGCSQYPDGEIRRYNRGNMGHNTLTIDGMNQSEVWGAHRCARRARPRNATIEQLGDGTLRFSGSHDGYRRLPGKPIHHRTVTWSGTAVAIDDHVEGTDRHDLVLRLHVNPDLEVEMVGGRGVIRHASVVVATVVPAAGALELDQGWYCPEFGRILPCPVFVVSFPGSVLPFRGGWLIDISPL